MRVRVRAGTMSIDQLSRPDVALLQEALTIARDRFRGRAVDSDALARNAEHRAKHESKDRAVPCIPSTEAVASLTAEAARYRVASEHAARFANVLVDGMRRLK